MLHSQASHLPAVITDYGSTIIRQQSYADTVPLVLGLDNQPQLLDRIHRNCCEIGKVIHNKQTSTLRDRMPPICQPIPLPWGSYSTTKPSWFGMLLIQRGFLILAHRLTYLITDFVTTAIPPCRTPILLPWWSDSTTKPSFRTESIEIFVMTMVICNISQTSHLPALITDFGYTIHVVVQLLRCYH